MVGINLYLETGPMEATITIIQCAKMRLRPNSWPVTNPRKPYWRLYWADGLGCTVVRDEHELELSTDMVVLIPPDTHFRGLIKQPVHQLFIHFTADHLAAPTPSVISVRNPVWISELITFASARPAGKALDKDTFATCLKFVVNALAELPPCHLRRTQLDTRMLRMGQVMKTVHASPLSNDELASMLNMSTRGFLRLFNTYFGTSPQSFYLRKRLEAALVALETTDDTIEAIAGNHGFCDRNYFSAVFKKHFNASPAGYRRDNRL